MACHTSLVFNLAGLEESCEYECHLMDATDGALQALKMVKPSDDTALWFWIGRFAHACVQDSRDSYLDELIRHVVTRKDLHSPPPTSSRESSPATLDKQLQFLDHSGILSCLLCSCHHDILNIIIESWKGPQHPNRFSPVLARLFLDEKSDLGMMQEESGITGITGDVNQDIELESVPVGKVRISESEGEGEVERQSFGRTRIGTGTATGSSPPPPPPPLLLSDQSPFSFLKLRSSSVGIVPPELSDIRFPVSKSLRLNPSTLHLFFDIVLPRFRALFSRGCHEMSAWGKFLDGVIVDEILVSWLRFPGKKKRDRERERERERERQGSGSGSEGGGGGGSGGSGSGSGGFREKLLSKFDDEIWTHVSDKLRDIVDKELFLEFGEIIRHDDFVRPCPSEPYPPAWIATRNLGHLKWEMLPGLPYSASNVIIAEIVNYYHPKCWSVFIQSGSDASALSNRQPSLPWTRLTWFFFLKSSLTTVLKFLLHDHSILGHARCKMTRKLNILTLLYKLANKFIKEIVQRNYEEMIDICRTMLDDLVAKETSPERAFHVLEDSINETEKLAKRSLDVAIKKCLRTIRLYFPKLYRANCASRPVTADILTHWDRRLVGGDPTIPEDDFFALLTTVTADEDAFKGLRLVIHSNVWKYALRIAEDVLRNRSLCREARVQLALKWDHPVHFRAFGLKTWGRLIQWIIEDEYDPLVTQCAFEIFKEFQGTMFVDFRESEDRVDRVLTVLVSHLDDEVAGEFLNFLILSNVQLRDTHIDALYSSLGSPQGHAEDALFLACEKGLISAAGLWKHLQSRIRDTPEQKLLKLVRRLLVFSGDVLGPDDLDRAPLLLDAAYKNKDIDLLKEYKKRLPPTKESDDMIRASIGSCLMRESEEKSSVIRQAVITWAVSVLELFPKLLCPMVRSKLPRSVGDYVRRNLTSLESDLCESLAVKWQPSEYNERIFFYFACGWPLVEAFVGDEEVGTRTESLLVAMLKAEDLFHLFYFDMVHVQFFEKVLARHRKKVLVQVLRHVDHHFQLFRGFFGDMTDLKNHRDEVRILLANDPGKHWTRFFLTEKRFGEQLFRSDASMRTHQPLIQLMLKSDESQVIECVSKFGGDEAKAKFSERNPSSSPRAGSDSRSNYESLLAEEEASSRRKRKGKPKKKRKPKRRGRSRRGANDRRFSSPKSEEVITVKRKKVASTGQIGGGGEKQFSMQELSTLDYETFYPGDQPSQQKQAGRKRSNSGGRMSPVAASGSKPRRKKRRRGSASQARSVVPGDVSPGDPSSGASNPLPKPPTPPGPVYGHCRYVLGSMKEYNERLEVVRWMKEFLKNLNCECFLYGSVAFGTFTRGVSDIDLLVVVSRESPLATRGPVLDVLSEYLEEQKRVQTVSSVNARVPLVKARISGYDVDLSLRASHNGVVANCFLTLVDKTVGHRHLFKRTIAILREWARSHDILSGMSCLSSYCLNVLVLHLLTQSTKQIVITDELTPRKLLARWIRYYRSFSFSATSRVEVVPREGVLSEEDLLRYRAWVQRFPSSVLIWRDNGFMSIVDPLLPENNLAGHIKRENFEAISHALREPATKELRRTLRAQPRVECEILDIVHSSCEEATLERLLAAVSSTE